MKTLVVILVLICFLAVGYILRLPSDRVKQLAAPNRDQAPGEVVFDNAGISLKPGAAWQKISIDALATNETDGLCVPVLMLETNGVVSVIKVYTTVIRQNPQAVLGILEKNISSDPHVITCSLQNPKFQSVEGLTGQHISYDYDSVTTGRTNRFRTHAYLFRNKSMYCVVLNYIAPADAVNPDVDQMIRQTLSLK